ncbi:MAG: dihydrofolate reductase family protein [Oscillospiraceae bacterium]|nr:dihydrofolate reductase family protein [Oscillospiraceae bacterium]
MRKVILYIAMSLDGYIADVNGKVDWLDGYDSGDSYSDFVKEIDTVVMGNKTYRQVVTELSPDEWVYKDFTSYVITNNTDHKDGNVIFYNGSPCDLIKGIIERNGRNIWVCGGADIVRQLMSDGLIDRFHIFVIPVILGGGVRLFANSDEKVELRLLKEKVCNDIIEVIYEKR